MKNILKKNQIMITALAIMIAIAGYLHFAGEKIGEEELMTVDSNAVTSEAFHSVELDADIENDVAVMDGLEEAGADLAMLDISDEYIEQAEFVDIESLDSDVDLSSANYLDEAMAEELALADEAVASEELAMGEDGIVNAEVAEVSTDNVTGTGADEIPGEAVFTSTTNVTTLAGAKLLKEQTRARNKETLLEIINNANVDEAQKQSAIDNMIAMTDIAEKETSAEVLLEAKGFADVVVSMSGEYVDVIVKAGELTDAQRAQIEDIVKRKTGIPAENIIISPVAQQ